MGANFALAASAVGIVLTLLRMSLDLADVMPATHRAIDRWRLFGFSSFVVLVTATICKVF